MKTQEEIRKMAEKEMMGMEGKFGFVAGYEKCQEDYKDKRYIDEHMLLAYITGATNLAEDKDATKMKENFNRLMAAIDKSIDGNTSN